MAKVMGWFSLVKKFEKFSEKIKPMEKSKCLVVRNGKPGNKKYA